MSHYTIDYSNMTEAQQEEQAMEDIVSYLGEERFGIVELALKAAIADGCTEQQVCMSLALFVGVDGLPARVWYKRLSQ